MDRSSCTEVMAMPILLEYWMCVSAKRAQTAVFSVLLFFMLCLVCVVELIQVAVGPLSHVSPLCVMKPPEAFVQESGPCIFGHVRLCLHHLDSPKFAMQG